MPLHLIISPRSHLPVAFGQTSPFLPDITKQPAHYKPTDHFAAKRCKRASLAMTSSFPTANVTARSWLPSQRPLGGAEWPFFRSQRRAVHTAHMHLQVELGAEHLIADDASRFPAVHGPVPGQRVAHGESLVALVTCPHQLTITQHGAWKQRQLCSLLAETADSTQTDSNYVNSTQLNSKSCRASKMVDNQKRSIPWLLSLLVWSMQHMFMERPRKHITFTRCNRHSARAKTKQQLRKVRHDV